MAATVAMDLYAPFDTGAGADVTESFWRQFMKHMRDDGVIATVNYPPDDPSELRVSGTSAGLQVTVEPGECWIQAHWGGLNSSVDLPIATADPTNPRVDLVVARADFLGNVIELDVKTGTPAATPSAPALQRDTDAWEIPLAHVAVAADETSIDAADVTDKRRRIGLGVFSYEDPVLFTVNDGSGGPTDTAVALGPGGSKTCRWHLQGKILHVRYDFRWDPSGTGLFAGHDEVFTNLPAGLQSAANGSHWLWCHLWTHNAGGSPVDHDFIGLAEVVAGAEFVHPYFPLSGSDARIGRYKITNDGNPGTGVPLLTGQYSWGGSLVISGHLEVK